MKAVRQTTSIHASDSLVSNKLAHELIKFVTTPARLLGVNAGLAYIDAIYRLRTLSDCGLSSESDAASESESDNSSAADFPSCKGSDSDCSCIEIGNNIGNDSDSNEEEPNQDTHSLHQMNHDGDNGRPISSTVSGNRHFTRYLIRYIKDLEDLKALDSKLREKQAPFRLTILPEEPLLENTSIEELEKMTMNNFTLSQFVKPETLDLIAYNGIETIKHMPNYGKHVFGNHLVDEEFCQLENPAHWKTFIECGKQDRELLKVQAVRNLAYREVAKERSSKLYRAFKRLESKLKFDHGMMSRFLQERQWQKWERALEETAWRGGLSAWRLSMLDQKWWDTKGCDRNPVWNNSHYDLAPKLSREERENDNEVE